MGFHKSEYIRQRVRSRLGTPACETPLDDNIMELVIAPWVAGIRGPAITLYYSKSRVSFNIFLSC